MRVPTRAANHQHGSAQDAEEKKIADLCYPMMGVYGMSTVALQSALESKHTSSEIYRALKDDPRFVNKREIDGVTTLFWRKP